MTMPYSPGRALFEGNGTATDFPFSFKVWGTEQLTVTLTGPDGNSRPASGWTARLNDDGGSVTYLHEGAPLPAGWKLAITRNMPFEQQIDLVSGTRFDAEVIETGLDRATAERQQLLEQLQRAVILPPTSDETPIKMAEQLLQAGKAAQGSAAAAHSVQRFAVRSQRTGRSCLGRSRRPKPGSGSRQYRRCLPKRHGSPPERGGRGRERGQGRPERRVHPGIAGGGVHARSRTARRRRL